MVELPTNIVMQVAMNYTAANQTCVLTITTNGVAVVVPVVVVLNAPGVYFGDYHLDAFAVESYSDAGLGRSRCWPTATIGNVRAGGAATAGDVSCSRRWSTGWGRCNLPAGRTGIMSCKAVPICRPGCRRGHRSPGRAAI